MKTATTTFKNVELVKVGHWLSGRGEARVTEEHLRDAVQAFTDPEIDHAPIKIGHVGGLALGDGAPAAGWVVKPRLSADGKTLLGDLADIPTKLAEIIPRAFKRRSIEMSLNVSTPGGKRYAAAVTGLALLGASAPAVKGLADILDIYASADDGHSGADDTTREDVATILLSDDTPGVPQPNAESGDADNVNGSHEPDKDSRGKDADVAFTDAQKKKLIESLGLAPEATEADILAALETAEIKPADGADTDADKGEKDGEKDGDKPDAAADAGAPAAQPGQVVEMSAVQLSEMQSEIADLRKDAAKRRISETLTVALSEGKIAPAERAHWLGALEKNEEGTTALLKNLQPRFSTVELGADTAPAATADAEAALLKQAEEAGI